MSDQLPCKQCGHYAVFCDDQREALSAQVRELHSENEVLQEQNFAMNKTISELQQSLSTAREEREIFYDMMHKLSDWTRAYPLSVFPEPDLFKAHKFLQDVGMTLDSISASAMRHVLKGVETILAETDIAIRALKPTGGETK